MRTIWLIGAEGIGKSHHGHRVAIEFGLDFLQLDNLRSSAWEMLRVGGAFADTDYRACGRYEEARSLALKDVETYLDLYARLGPPMVTALQRELAVLRTAGVLVECAAKYLPAIPPRGLRLRTFVDSARHRQNLRIRCACSPRDARRMSDFLQLAEAEVLARNRVDIHVALDDLAATLRGFLSCSG